LTHVCDLSSPQRRSIPSRWLAAHFLYVILPACPFLLSRARPLLDERDCAPPLSAVAGTVFPMLFRAMSTCAQHNTSVVASLSVLPPDPEWLGKVRGGKTRWMCARTSEDAEWTVVRSMQRDMW